MIDLHIHSNYSGDADFDPAVLVKMCHEAGVTTMAIADRIYRVSGDRMVREK